MPKKNCLNCHFATITARTVGYEENSILNEDQRGDIQHGKHDFIANGTSIECDYSMWYSNLSGIDPIELCKSLPKKKCPNFFRYDKNNRASLPALKSMRIDSRNKRLLVISSIAAVAAVISALYPLIKPFIL